MGEFNLIWNALVPPREISDDAEIPDPVGSMFRRAAFPGSDTLAKSAGWDEPLGEPIAKRAPETNPTPFAKGTAAHTMGLTHIENREIDGDTWSYGFRGNELVDVKLLSIGA